MSGQLDKPEYASDDSLIKLNQAIEAALRSYLPGAFKDGNDAIRFNMVSKDNLPDGPTVCVFLHDVQEDTGLRQGQPRQYLPVKGEFAPRQVNIRCSYLLTYWDNVNDKIVKADGQEMLMMNMVLNALLNMQLPQSFVRALTSSEQLSGLGNFWQSTGETPRLCLNLTVTIPVTLGPGRKEAPPPVRQITADVTASLWGQEELALRFKRALVSHAMSDSTIKTDPVLMREQLARLQVSCRYYTAENTLLTPPAISISGLLDENMHMALPGIIDAVKAEAGLKAGINTDGVTSVPLPAAGTPR